MTQVLTIFYRNNTRVLYLKVRIKIFVINKKLQGQAQITLNVREILFITKLKVSLERNMDQSTTQLGNLLASVDELS